MALRRDTIRTGGHENPSLVGLLHTFTREDDGALAARGDVDLPPGDYACGIDLNIDDSRRHHDNRDLIVVLRGRILAVTVYLDGTRPAWPECQITVGVPVPAYGEPLHGSH